MSDWLVGDLPGWIAVILAIAFGVLAYLAFLRAQPSRITFGDAVWIAGFRRVAEGSDWGRLVIRTKVAVTLLGSSTVVAGIECKATGPGVEVNLEEKQNVGLLVKDGAVLFLYFERDGCTVPRNVTHLNLTGSIMLDDGTRKKFRKQVIVQHRDLSSPQPAEDA